MLDVCERSSDSYIILHSDEGDGRLLSVVTAYASMLGPVSVCWTSGGPRGIALRGILNFDEG